MKKNAFYLIRNFHYSVRFKIRWWIESVSHFTFKMETTLELSIVYQILAGNRKTKRLLSLSRIQ